MATKQHPPVESISRSITQEGCAQPLGFGLLWLRPPFTVFLYAGLLGKQGAAFSRLRTKGRRMPDEYRVVYDVNKRCDCPDCPVRNHITPNVEYGTYDDMVRADRAYDKAHNVDNAENVRVQKRTVTEWEESL